MQSAIYTQDWSQQGEKRAFIYARAEYYLQPNIKAKQSWMTERMSRPLFCTHLFAGHVVSSRPMKRKKNLQRMIINRIRRVEGKLGDVEQIKVCCFASLRLEIMGARKHKQALLFHAYYAPATQATVRREDDLKSLFFSGKQKPTKPPRTTKVPTTTQPPVRTGEDKNHPGKSCKVIKRENPQGGSGLYWINPDGRCAFQAYCDQETDSGGWTLVYSYKFTNYQ